MLKPAPPDQAASPKFSHSSQPGGAKLMERPGPPSVFLFCTA
jgi:hypothetical protein